MLPATRTPEGRPNLCPICGKALCVEPSMPPGDAPCPNCGHLVWFDPGIEETNSELEGVLLLLFQEAVNELNQNRPDKASQLFHLLVQRDPGNLVYAIAFMRSSYEKHNYEKSRAKPVDETLRQMIRRAVADLYWRTVIRRCVDVLLANPWDVPTLEALSDACKNLADETDSDAKQAGLLECSEYYLKCVGKSSF